jgi:hypothetical protein
MVEYVIHGTSVNNIFHILESGKLETNPKHAQKFLDENRWNPNQIFTNILIRDLPNEERQKAYWFGFGIVLDKKILKDKKWYATKIGGFFEKFTDAFKNNDETQQLVLSRNRKGNASRMPNIARLKNHIINDRMDNTLSLGESGFIHSHEVLFGEDIPLAEYGICILVQEKLFNKILNKTQQDKIKQRCNELGMGLIVYKPMIPGINKTIDLIKTIAKSSVPL